MTFFIENHDIVYKDFFIKVTLLLFELLNFS